LAQTAPFSQTTRQLFEFASKKTSSTLVGADAPLGPPDVADQFAVEVAFQMAETVATQYLFAITTP
jgi:hypothetical protein